MTTAATSFAEEALARLQRTVARGAAGPELDMYAAEALLYGVAPHDVRDLLGLDDLGMKRIEHIMREFADDDAEVDREAAERQATRPVGISERLRDQSPPTGLR